MTNTIVAVDVETTGLDPDRHHIWEVGLIVRGHQRPEMDGRWHIMIRPHLNCADPDALTVSGFYRRAPRYLYPTDHATTNGVPAYVIEKPFRAPGLALGVADRMPVARTLAQMLDGATLVGINPAFDAAFLARFLRGHWQAPTWNHRLVDVVPLAAGFLSGCRTGYNTGVTWLAGHHNTAAGEACPAVAPDLDTVTLPAPVWSASDLSRRLGLDPPGPADRHTALGDAAWAIDIYDHVLTD